jgi:2-polyprenyl-3-methyl-5-hydroxy-6-metoxy-1,4-benzoquinol methylase
MASKTQSQRHPLQPKNWSLGSLHDRFAYIRPYVEGRSVLDIGCAVGEHREDWMHGLIRGVAAETVALDHDIARIDSLRERGYEIILGDAEDFDLGRTFDVIVAGELIEHLVNFRGFLVSVAKHLRPDSLFVLTTPNPFGFTNFLYRLGSGPVRINPDHTCWFCEQTIRQLLERFDFEVTELRYITHRTPGTVRRVFASAARRFLPPRLAWGEMLVVARLTS